MNSGSEKSLKLNQNYLFLCLVLLQVPYSSSLYDHTSACFSFREGTAKTGTENPRRNKEFLIPLAVLCLCLLNPYVNHASMLIMDVASVSLSQSHYSTKMYAASFTSLLSGCLFDEGKHLHSHLKGRAPRGRACKSL